MRLSHTDAGGFKACPGLIPLGGHMTSSVSPAKKLRTQAVAELDNDMECIRANSDQDGWHEVSLGKGRRTAALISNVQQLDSAPQSGVPSSTSSPLAGDNSSNGCSSDKQGAERLGKSSSPGLAAADAIATIAAHHHAVLNNGGQSGVKDTMLTPSNDTAVHSTIHNHPAAGSIALAESKAATGTLGLEKGDDAAANKPADITMSDLQSLPAATPLAPADFTVPASPQPFAVHVAVGIPSNSTLGQGTSGATAASADAAQAHHEPSQDLVEGPSTTPMPKISSSPAAKSQPTAAALPADAPIVTAGAPAATAAACPSPQSRAASATAALNLTMHLASSSVGTATLQGMRQYQEDRCHVLPQPVGPSVLAACAVYDGHGGEAVAEYLKRPVGHLLGDVVDVVNQHLAPAALHKQGAEPSAAHGKDGSNQPAAHSKDNSGHQSGALKRSASVEQADVGAGPVVAMKEGELLDAVNSGSAASEQQSGGAELAQPGSPATDSFMHAQDFDSAAAAAACGGTGSVPSTMQGHVPALQTDGGAAQSAAADSRACSEQLSHALPEDIIISPVESPAVSPARTAADGPDVHALHAALEGVFIRANSQLLQGTDLDAGACAVISVLCRAGPGQEPCLVTANCGDSRAVLISSCATMPVSSYMSSFPITSAKSNRTSAGSAAAVDGPVDGDNGTAAGDEGSSAGVAAAAAAAGAAAAAAAANGNGVVKSYSSVVSSGSNGTPGGWGGRRPGGMQRDLSMNAARARHGTLTGMGGRAGFLSVGGGFNGDGGVDGGGGGNVEGGQRGVVGSRLSNDHKLASPHCSAETRRIQSAGGWVYAGWCGEAWRLVVNGLSLNIARAFGDRRAAQYVSAAPYVSVAHLSPADRYVVLASDGLFDRMTDADVADHVAAADAAGLDPQAIASSLAEEAVVRLYSADNVTVVVMRLNWEADEA